MASGVVIQEPARPFFIRVLTRIATGIQFFESVGALFIFWLCPKLAPTPAMHQYIISSPQRSTSTPATTTTTTSGTPGDGGRPSGHSQRKGPTTVRPKFRRQSSRHRRSRSIRQPRLEELELDFNHSDYELDGLRSISYDEDDSDDVDESSSGYVRSFSGTSSSRPQLGAGSGGETGGGPGVDASALRKALTIVEFNSKAELRGRREESRPRDGAIIDNTEVVVTRVEERIVGTRLVDSSS